MELPPPEAILGAFSTVLEGASLIRKSAIWKKVQIWRGKEPQQLKLRSALDAALAETSAEYPFLQASLFDELFLQKSATHLIQLSLGAKSVTSIRDNLLQAWLSELGTTLTHDAEQEMSAAIEHFLQSLEGELLKHEEFRALLVAKYQQDSASSLSSIESNVNKLADIAASWSMRGLQPSQDHPVTRLDVLDDWRLPVPYHLVGRDDEVEWLVQRLRSGKESLIVALNGMAGIGKTAIAGAVVRRLQTEKVLRDGIAVIACQDMTNPADLLMQVLDRFQSQMAASESDDYHKVAEAVVRLLQHRKALVVLDNIEPQLDIDEVLRPLQAAGLCILMTSRHVVSSTVISPDECRTIRPLPPDDVIHLFNQYMYGHEDQSLTDVDQLAIAVIVKHLAFHTLAVKLAAAYARETSRDLQELADELSDPRRALSLPQGEVPDAVRLVFATSLEQLPPPAKLLFGNLALFSDEGFGRRAALEIARQCDANHPEHLLDLLIRWALIEAFTSSQLPKGSERERLRLHPLLRALAEADLENRSEAEQDECQRLLAEHYKDLLEQTDAMSAADMFAAITPDASNIRGSLVWAYSRDQDVLTSALCFAMQPYWLYAWHITDSLLYSSYGIEAARRQLQETGSEEDKWALASLESFRGEALVHSGQVEEAIAALEANPLVNADPAGKQQGMGSALCILGRAYSAAGRLEEATNCFQRALRVFQTSGSSLNIGSAYFELANVAREVGRPKEVVRNCELALKELEETGDQAAIGATLGLIAHANLELGNLSEAERVGAHALAILKEINLKREQVVVLFTMARVAFASGQLDQAERHYSECLQLRRTFEDAPNEVPLLLGLGQVEYARRQFLAAYRYYQQALELLKRFGDRREEGVVTFELALVADAMGDSDLAEGLHRQSLNIAKEVGNATDVADSYRELGALLAGKGRRSEAAEMMEKAVQIYFDLGMKGKALVTRHRLEELS